MRVTMLDEQRAGVSGSVASGFEAVRRRFVEQVTEVGLGGAAIAVVADGEIVVDLWAGHAGGQPWHRATRGVLMSATKGLTTIVLAQLVELGKVQLDSPVADYWREFAVHGKHDITVRQVLTHAAGLVTVPGYRDFIDADGNGWELKDEIIRRLESATPAWEPGTHHGYHGLTFGWLVGEIVERASGETVGSLIRRELSQPLQLEIEIGTPPGDQKDVAVVVVAGPQLTSPDEARRLRDPSSLFSQMMLVVDGHSVLDRADRVFGDPARLAIELPGTNGTGTARDLAQVYGTLVSRHPRRDRRPLRSETVDEFRAEQRRGTSIVTGLEERWGVGFALAPTNEIRPTEGWGPHAESFGHPGLGGQIAFADPVEHLGIAFVRSHLTSASPLGGALVDEVYACL